MEKLQALERDNLAEGHHAQLPDRVQLKSYLNNVDEIMEYQKDQNKQDQNDLKKQYGRIADLMDLEVQFWDFEYHYFSMGDVNMTLTLEEYQQALTHPLPLTKIYLHLIRNPGMARLSK